MPVHRSLSARAALCAAALMLAACGPGAKKSAPEGMRRLNVVLVTLDTLRADRLGHTPNLDRLARKGVLFENAVAQAPLTSPSHASMMTGQYPTTHKVRDTGGFVLAPSDHTLAAILQRQGWETAAFVGSSVLKRRFGFNHGFAVYDDEMKENAERRAGEVVDRAVAWLEKQSGKPFFLWVHVYDPHLPYSPPAPFPQTLRRRGGLHGPGAWAACSTPWSGSRIRSWRRSPTTARASPSTASTRTACSCMTPRCASPSSWQDRECRQGAVCGSRRAPSTCCPRCLT